MGIGTIAAIALGAGAIGSAAIGAGAAGKASKAATQAADSSAAVQREQLQAAQTRLDPYQQAGLPAVSAINSFLGLTPTQQPAQQMPTPQPNALAQFAGGYDPAGGYYAPDDFTGSKFPFQWQAQQGAYGQQQPNAMAAPQVNGQDAFRKYIENSDYGFRFGEGANALNSGYAGAGTVKSGAAMKGLEQFRQNLQSGYRGEWLNNVGNQQALGFSAGSALAGVGQNYANSLGVINSNKADAIGNAALANASNFNSLIGGIGSAALKYGMK